MSFSSGIMGQGAGDSEARGQQMVVDRGVLQYAPAMLHPARAVPNRPGYDATEEPMRTAWERYRVEVESFNRRQEAARSSGRLLVSEQQMGDAAFMASNQHVISAASRLGVLDVQRAPEAPE